MAETKGIFSQLRDYFFIIKIKSIKPLKASITLILGVLTLSSILNANAAGFSSHIEMKTEIECLSNDKKCIEAKEKESKYNVEV